MAMKLSTWQMVGFIPGFVPMCEPQMCWRSCAGAETTDQDSFEHCKMPECADRNCLDFLKLECEASTHSELDRIYDSACRLKCPRHPRRRRRFPWHFSRVDPKVPYFSRKFPRVVTWLARLLAIS